jgi:hypothetical protein
VRTKTESCQECERGVGHCSLMIGFDLESDPGDICVVKCRTCKSTLTFGATDEEECCDHRYVGEDLYRAEAYSGQWDDPI